MTPTPAIATSTNTAIDFRTLRKEWIRVTALAGVVSWLISVGAALVTFGVGIALAPGVAMGLSLGFAQDQVLTRHGILTSSTKWLFHSFLGGLVGWIVILAIGTGGQVIYYESTNRALASNPLLTTIALPAAAALFGLIFGTIQWSSLRRRGGAWWALVNAFAWSSGASLGFYVALATFGDQSGGYLLGYGAFAFALLGGSICTATVGVLTGGSLVVLVRRDLDQLTPTSK